MPAELARHKAVHGELEGARTAFHELLTGASDEEPRRRSVGTRWMNKQLLFHMLLGYLIIRALTRLIELEAVRCGHPAQPYASRTRPPASTLLGHVGLGLDITLLQADHLAATSGPPRRAGVGFPTPSRPSTSSSPLSIDVIRTQSCWGTTRKRSFGSPATGCNSLTATSTMVGVSRHTMPVSPKHLAKSLVRNLRVARGWSRARR